MMKFRSLFARLALVSIPALSACATDPAETTPDASAPDEPQPEPEQPAPLAAGTLDPAFGSGGILALDAGAAYGAAIEAQGDKLIACVTHIDGAAWTARVLRLELDGTLDTTFGTEGRVTIGAAGNVGCQDLAVMDDGRILLGYRVHAKATPSTTWISADGKTVGAVVSLNTAFSRLTAAQDRGVVATLSGGTLAVITVTDNGTGTMSSPLSADMAVRGFIDASSKRSAVLRTNDPGGTSWQVAKTNANDELMLLGSTARASAGTATADLLHDAIRLPDGSYFAVGGMDSDVQVMVARFVDGASPQVDIEHHLIGGPASANSVALDGADRPIVVGKALDMGLSQFAWHRYAASSVTLDASYQGDGIATAAAPSGQGELIDVVHAGGAMYAIGSYDVETASPKVAIVKIAE